MKARIHWNKQRRCWTIHTYKGCEWAEVILLRGPWVTETKPTNKSNPRGFVVANREQLNIMSTDAEHDYLSGSPILYDKTNILFNMEFGIDALFTPEGAFTAYRAADLKLSPERLGL